MNCGTPGTQPDLLCFSHLRWNFVFQRPQHLMTRCAAERRVFFIEEPILSDVAVPYLHTDDVDGVRVVTPHLPHGLDDAAITSAQRRLLNELLERERIVDYVAWYYTPMPLAFTDHLRPVATVYDCMDELSAFHGAPAALKAREAELMSRADLMLTGGQALYEAKRDQHRNIHPFPSSVDVEHFARARRIVEEPPDQAPIARPRLGFFGVIDERMDIELLDGVAARRPDWQIVLLGPVVKIDPATLPRRANVHYLGGKKYRGAAAVRRRLGRRAPAVRAQRRDALHQPDEDAGVHGGGEAGGIDVDPRRRAALRPAGARADRRHRQCVRRSLRGGDGGERLGAHHPGGRLSAPDIVGRHLAAHQTSDGRGHPS
jgi:hypothetical protein